MTNRVELTVPDDLWDRLEKVRGPEPRASFVKRAVAHACDLMEESPRYGDPLAPKVKLTGTWNAP